MANYEFKLGATAGTLEYVEDVLGIPPHPWEYHLGSTDQYIAGTGQAYIDGYPAVTWTFEFLTVAAWQALIALFGSDQSIQYTIKTKNDTDAFVTMDGIMHRPIVGQHGSRGVGGWFGVILRFSHLVAS